MMFLEPDADTDMRTAMSLWVDEGRQLLNKYPCSPQQRALLSDGIEHVHTMFETVEEDQ